VYILQIDEKDAGGLSPNEKRQQPSDDINYSWQQMITKATDTVRCHGNRGT
jgi:hypothetical protein